MASTLPPELSPWRGPLEALAPDLALELGPWIRRLSGLFGPCHSPQPDAEGEPDGLAGLSRRGPYERLSISEWALAFDQPSEFLRRAAMGEQLFLDLARVDTAGRPRVRVFFDTGPEQLGAPRLAHPALLVVLAARAAAIRADFAWGVLQEPDLGLRRTVDGDAFRSLAESRSPRLPSIEDCEQAIGRETPETLDREAGGQGLGPKEIFWIGGERLSKRLIPLRARRRGSRQRRIVVSEKDSSAGPRQLELRLLSAEDAPRSVRLELPATATQVRLLRDPTRQRMPIPEASVEARGHIALASGDQRLLLWGPRDHLRAVHIPLDRGQRAGKSKTFPLIHGHLLVAAGFQGKRWLGVSLDQGTGLDQGAGLDESTVRAYGFGTASARRKGPVGLYNEFEGPWPTPLDPGPPPPPCLLHVDSHTLLFMDGQQALYSARFPQRTFCRVVDRVAAMGRSAGATLVFVDDPGPSGVEPRSIARYRFGKNGEPARLEPFRSLPATDPEKPWRVLWGRTPPGPNPDTPNPELLVAQEVGPGIWSLVAEEGIRELHPGSDAEVVGVAYSKSGEPGLLVIEADGRTLVHAGLRWSRKVVRATSTIRQVVVGRSTPRIALACAATDNEGRETIEVQVLTLGEDRMILRGRPGQLL